MGRPATPHLVAAAGIRFPVEPRHVPAAKAARRLHLTVEQFDEKLPRLRMRGFPRPDPDTGNYDLKAIDVWMDRQSGLASDAPAEDAEVSFNDRLSALRGTGTRHHR